MEQRKHYPFTQNPFFLSESLEHTNPLKVYPGPAFLSRDYGNVMEKLRCLRNNTVFVRCNLVTHQFYLFRSWGKHSRNSLIVYFISFFMELHIVSVLSIILY